MRRPHRAALPDRQVACGGWGKASALTSNSHSFRQAQHLRPRRMRPGLPSTMPALKRTPGEPHCGHDGASAESDGLGAIGRTLDPASEARKVALHRSEGKRVPGVPPALFGSKTVQPGRAWRVDARKYWGGCAPCGGSSNY